MGWFISPAGEAVPALCQKLTCPVCSPGKLRRYRARLSRVKWLRMLTLTMPARGPAGSPLDVSIKVQAEAWRVLSRWLKRNTAMKEYVWCREITQIAAERPNLHQHVLLNSNYIPTGISKRKFKSLLNEAVVRAGYGPIFKLNKVRGRVAQYYVTKYVSKCTQALPRYTRRLQTNVPNLRNGDGGWSFQTLGQREFKSGLYDVCAHGALRPCAECSEDTARAEAAKIAAERGRTLNLIPNMKNCVTRRNADAWIWLSEATGGTRDGP